MTLSPVIILVEDSEADRLLYSTYISQAGYECISYESGEALLAHAGAIKPSLILLDIEMPGFNGFETIQLMKEQPAAEGCRHMYVAVTSHSEKQILDKLVAAGFGECLQKPFTRNELQKLVARYLKNSDKNCISNITSNNGTNSDGKLYSLSMFDGEDPEFVKSIIEMFVKNTPASIDTLHIAFSESNMELLRQTAHKLKPHFTFFGIDEVHHALQQIENIAAGASIENNLNTLLECVSNRSVAVIDQMKHDFLN